MKKCVLTASFVLLAGLAAGHGGSHSALPEPGQTPGSLFYGLEQTYESVSLALTFDEEQKVRKRVKFAQERLSESAHLVQENKTQKAARASQEYLELMNEAEESAAELNNTELSEHVSETQRNNTGILSDLEERLPEQASKGLQRAMKNINRTPARKTGNR